MSDTTKNIKLNLDYSEFITGMSESQKSMATLRQECKLYESQIKTNSGDTSSYTSLIGNLNSQIEQQQSRVQAAADKFNILSTSEDATRRQVDAAEKALYKEMTTLSELQNKLGTVTERMEELASAEEDVPENTKNAADEMNGLDMSLSRVITTTAATVIALEQIAEQLLNTAKAATEYADELSTLSSQTNISRETLQEWGYAANFVDVSVDTMTGSMTRLTRAMGEAQNGSEAALQKFDSLGISITNADGSLKNAKDVFLEAIDALGEIENVAERDAASMELFGRSAQQLNPLIEQGSSALQRYGEEAQRLGLVMSENQLDSLNSINDSFDRMAAVTEMAGMKLGASLAPAIQSVADIVTALPTPVLEVVAAIGLTVTTIQALLPILQTYTMIQQLSMMAKIANTTATIAETDAEVGLGVAATVTNTALLPQIATVALLIAAFAGLVAIIYMIIEAFNGEADAADRASDATSRLMNSAANITTQSAVTSTQYMAAGGIAKGGRTWVGEHGAELVDLPAGSRVYNASDSRNMSRNSTIYNITIDAKNVSDFNRVVNMVGGLEQSMNRGGSVNG